MKGYLLHFINRVLYPYYILKTYEEVLQFENPDIEFDEARSKFYSGHYTPLGPSFDELKKKTRVIGFFGNKLDFKTELRLFKDAAQSLYFRDELRLGLVTDKALVQRV